MTIEELIIRQNKIAAAFAMFPEERNVQQAIIKYNETLPEEERISVFINTADVPKRTVNIIDLYGRPECPNCGAYMMIRPLPPNSDGYKSQLVCDNEDCDTVLNSIYTVEEWVNALKEKYEARRNAVESDKSVEER